MKINSIYIIGILILAVLALSAVRAQMYEVNYNNTGNINQANLVVQVLKYEPYPVNAGDWFDVWIKVQNIGQADAENVKFVLQPEYPFSSNDSLTRDYGIVLGTINSYKLGMSNDANEIILKYRVKTADNAPEGTSELKLVIYTDASTQGSNAVINSLPITIGKTKTDFSVVMQDSTSQGTSFSIANIGDNSATAVTVSIPTQANVKITGAQSSIIGNLEKGDFTTVTFKIASDDNLNSLTMQIAYTDIAGVRNIVNETVPVSIAHVQETVKQTGNGSSIYIYLIVGIAIGAAAVAVYSRVKGKK
jgi:hypothetical protein